MAIYPWIMYDSSLFATDATTGTPIYLPRNPCWQVGYASGSPLPSVKPSRWNEAQRPRITVSPPLPGFEASACLLNQKQKAIKEKKKTDCLINS